MKIGFWVAAQLLFTSVACAADPSNLAELKRAFANPPDGARIMMRWWWFGPSVAKPELEREMRKMKEGGIGGFEVQTTYPLTVDGNFNYLSPEFLDDLRFVSEKARELGLRMDVTLGSGWPFGGPHIPITEAAGRLRVERILIHAGDSLPQPSIGDGEKLLAAFWANGDRIDLSAPNISGEGELVFFIASRTRQVVKRAAVGAEGFVLDHYDRAAIDNHLAAVGEKLVGALGKNPPHAVFSDSLEVYGSDWTGNFLEEFKKRRGYDLTPHLPALAGDVGEKTGSIRYDWGKTLTELAEENYLKPVREWARAHGTLFRSQTYGIPPVVLASNALVDLPEGEGWMWRRFSATRWAASASHIFGRPVTSSETWTWLHSPVFRATPLDVKAEADLHFLQGVNQLIGHGWPYSPPSEVEPGWRFYASAVFNEHNPWWIVMPDIATYLQRVSFLLRQGKPANDVAVYLPECDAYARFTLGHVLVNEAMDGLIGPTVIPQILDAGYNFDFIDDGAIAKAGIPYRILVVPGVERIPLATLRKIDEYVRHGGIAIATRRVPSLAPGLIEGEADTPKIVELANALFAANLVKDDADLGAALHVALAPDLATAQEIGFVHRKLPFADIYFLANTSSHPVRSQATFRIQDAHAAWWDPFSGVVTGASNDSKVDLDLAPYESRVVVFSKTQERIAPPERGTESIDISNGWKLQFSDSKLTVDALGSWTELEGRRFFSGMATYERTITLPATAKDVLLDLGEGTVVDVEERRAGSGMRAMFESPVREAAVVYVNGSRVGSVWKPPYRLRLANLHSGENEIRIVVANLATNGLAKGPLPDYKDLIARYSERFQAQDMASMQPQPSGLLGRVRLIVH